MMYEIGHALRAETSAALPRSGGSATTKSLVIENVGNFGIDVRVEELVDELNDSRWRLDLLRRCLGVQRREHISLATLEAHCESS